MDIILIRDKVKAATKSPGFPFEGEIGEVIASRADAIGEIEHQIRFTPKPDEDNDDPPEETLHVVWLKASEVSKVRAQT